MYLVKLFYLLEQSRVKRTFTGICISTNYSKLSTEYSSKFPIGFRQISYQCACECNNESVIKGVYLSKDPLIGNSLTGPSSDYDDSIPVNGTYLGQCHGSGSFETGSGSDLQECRRIRIRQIHTAL